MLAGQWFARAVSERDAHNRFLRLAEQLAGSAIYSPLCPKILEAAKDEKRHIELCMEQARRFGSGELPVYTGFTPFFTEEICELVTLFCVMETINAALLVSLRESLDDPVLRDCCHSILVDEVQHARIGWAALSLSDEKDRKLVWQALPAIFRAAGLHKIDRDDSIPLNDPEWGVFPREKRVEIFHQTMNAVILPGFMQFGWVQSSSLEDLLKA